MCTVEFVPMFSVPLCLLALFVQAHGCTTANCSSGLGYDWTTDAYKCMGTRSVKNMFIMLDLRCVLNFLLVNSRTSSMKVDSTISSMMNDESDQEKEQATASSASKL